MPRFLVFYTYILTFVHDIQSLYTETRIAEHGQTEKSFSFPVLVSLLGALRNSQKELSIFFP